MPVDYAALAKKHGASMPPQDYAALAKKHGAATQAATEPSPETAPNEEQPTFGSRLYDSTIGGPIELMKRMAVPGNTAVYDIGKGLVDRYKAAPGEHGVYGKAATALLGPVLDPIAEDVQAGRFGAAAGGIAGNALTIGAPKILGAAGRGAQAAKGAVSSAASTARAVMADETFQDALGLVSPRMMHGVKLANKGINVAQAGRQAFERLRAPKPTAPAPVPAKAAPVATEPVIADTPIGQVDPTDYESLLSQSLQRTKDKRFNNTPPAQVRELTKEARDTAKAKQAAATGEARDLKAGAISNFLHTSGVPYDSLRQLPLNDPFWETAAKATGQKPPSTVTVRQILLELKALEN